MQGGRIACKLGPLSAERIPENVCTLTEAVQSLAYIGNVDAFRVLPPIIMNDCETISQQQVWGSRSNAPSSGYVPGDPALFSDHTLLGAAMLPMGIEAAPVLLFANHASKQVVACVYDVKFSCLESDLYKQRDSPTEIEIKWKGSELASTHANLIELLGTFMKNIGVNALPDFLLSAGENNAYHLTRKGVIPFLHMRNAKSNAELTLMETLLLSHVNVCSKTLDPKSCKLQWEEFDQHSEYEFVTVFSKATIQQIVDRSGANVSQPKQTNDSTLDECRSILKKNPLSLCIACMMNLNQSQIGFDDINNALADADAAPLETSTNQLDVNASSVGFNEFLNMSDRIFSIRNLTSSSDGSSQAHAIATSVFGNEDVGMALRDLNTSNNARPVQQSNNIAVELAMRANPQNSVLMLQITTSRQVRSIRLVNADTNCVLDVDCAARILDCPWVVPIGVMPASKDFAKVFTLDSNGLKRDELRVCDRIRATYSTHFQHKLHALPLQLDFKPIDERLSRFHEMVSDAISSMSASSSTPDASSKKRSKRAENVEVEERASSLKRMNCAAEKLLASPNEH